MTPGLALSLWKGLLGSNDPCREYVLRAIFESVLIDYITNNMEHNDTFAVVIGRRLETMERAVGFDTEL